MTLDIVMVIWFAAVAASLAFVAIDIRRMPESAVMKWGFVIFTAFSGPLGVLLYVTACRSPDPAAHAEFVRPRWRQVVGSTMHCVAGDGLGILTAAAALSFVAAPMWLDIATEYAAGFLFGWTVFQSLFMKDMAGGSYVKSLRMTFLPEFVSMNAVMAGMLIVTVPWRAALGHPTAADPAFWFVMSIGLTVGFLAAYPMNWWLVARGLKHGMTTVTPRASNEATSDSRLPMRAMTSPEMTMTKRVGVGERASMVLVSVLAIAVGLALALSSPGG